MTTPQKLQESAVDCDHHQPLPPGTFILHSQLFSYPSLRQRYKAMAIDAILLLSILVVTMLVTGENENSAAILLGLTAGLSLYEPLLTKYSATVGQRLMGIRVRDYDRPTKPAGFWQAYSRTWIKGLLGWLSFITVHYNHEHRAIHDVASSTVVIMLA